MNISADGLQDDEIKIIIGDLYNPPKLFINGRDYSKGIVSIDYVYCTNDERDREHYYNITYYVQGTKDKHYKRTIAVSNIFDD